MSKADRSVGHVNSQSCESVENNRVPLVCKGDGGVIIIPEHFLFSFLLAVMVFLHPGVTGTQD